MGGNILTYPEKEIREEALKEGLETGRKEGLETGRKEGLETGREEGCEKERVKNIQKIMEKLKMTAPQAMDFLDIPRSEQSKYMVLLG